MSKLILNKESIELQFIKKKIERVNHRTIILWTIDCAKKLLPLFLENWQNEKRPYIALDAAEDWSKGNIKMKQAKAASKVTHQCARELNDESASAFAHAMGHVIGSVHVKTHALGFIIYSLTSYFHLEGSNVNLGKHLQWFSDKLSYWEEAEPKIERKWAKFL